MKKIITLLAFILCAETIHAQGFFQIMQPARQHTAILQNLLQHNNHNTAAKGTSMTIGQRIIAISYRDQLMDTLTDSVHFSYNTELPVPRSSYDYNMMLYPYNYCYATTPMFDYAGVSTSPKVLFDTMMHWQVNPNTLVFGFYEMAMAEYDSSASMTGFINLFADSSIYPNKQYVNDFDSAHEIRQGLSLTLAGGIADSLSKQYFKYDSLGMLTADSTYVLHGAGWLIASKSYYTYDTAGDLIQISTFANTSDTSFLLPLTEQLRYTNTYDTSHRLLTVLSEYYNGTALEPYVEDTFKYLGSQTIYYFWQQYQWDPINMYWAPQLYTYKFMDNPVADTMFVMSYDSLAGAWSFQNTEILHFNSMGNPDTLFDYESYLGPNLQSTTVYYYEPDTITVPDLGVPSQLATKSHFFVYPNPVADELFICTNEWNDHAKLTVTVYNSLGQIILRQGINESAPAIQLTGVIPGNYVITINDEPGRRLYSGMVIKK